MTHKLHMWFVTAAAHSSSTSEQLWLLGGVAVALTGAGVIALAATRGPKE